MLVALSLGLPPTPAANPRSLSTAAAAAGPSAAPRRPRRLLRGHQHLLPPQAPADTQTLAAELAKERELERELHDDEAENARAAAQLADAKLRSRASCATSSAGGRREPPTRGRLRSTTRSPGRRPTRRALRVVGANLERLQAALADIRRARSTGSIAELERTVTAAEAPRAHPAVEAPRAHTAAPAWPSVAEMADLERSSDDTEWVGATWPPTAARSSECASVRAFD